MLKQPRAVWAVAFACVIAFMGIGLVDKGWLRRDPHPDDARSTLVSMTTEGRHKLTAVRRRNADLVAERITSSGRSPEDLATAVAVLSDLLSHD